jgi:ribosomal protein S18 acetylase RimI-like enzyme
LRRQGYLEVVLWVLRDNHDAREFYERFGFALDGACKHLERLQVDGVRYRIRVGDRASTA